MPYPVTLGTGRLPENRKEYFFEETHEFLILTCDETVGYVSFRNDDGSWYHTAANMDVLGWVDLTTGEQNGERTKMEWTTTEEERSTRSYSKRFGKLKIYRVKAHPHRPFTGEKAKYNDEPKYAREIYVVGILGELIPNAFLFGVLDKYKTPVTMHSDILGDFVLDKRYGGTWECDVDWFGKKICFDFCDDTSEEFSVLIKNAEDFWLDRARWDKAMREYAAEELTYLANDWGDNSVNGEITEEEFACKINLCSVDFMSEGEFQAWFDDGGFFGDHSVTVWGHMDGSFDNARLEG